MKSENFLYEQGVPLLAMRLEAVHAYLLKVQETPESHRELVHQIRISARRSMAVLKFYRTLLPKRRVKWMKKQLKRIIATSNALRDIDVFSTLFLKQLPSSLYQQEKEKLRKERLLAQNPFTAICEKLLHEDLFKQRGEQLLDRFQKIQDQKKRTAHQRLLQEQLQTRIKKFFQNIPDRKSSLKALHQFRIRVKELHYLVELKFLNFSPNVSENMKLLQQKLGKMNDQAMFQIELSRRLKTADPESEVVLRQLLEKSEEQLTQMKEEFFHRYTSLFFKDFNKKMICFEKNSQ